MKIKALLILFLPIVVTAKNLHTESWYQQRTCSGQIEYRLDNGRRVDCLTKTHAIEHDFAKKAYECAGQALYYSAKTGRLPGCILIIESKKDCKYLEILREINRLIQIDTWTVGIVCD